MRCAKLLGLIPFLILGCSERYTPVDNPVSPQVQAPPNWIAVPPPAPSPIPIPYPDSPAITIVPLFGSPTVYSWFEARNVGAGTITAYNDAENLYVTISSSKAGVTALHGWVGTDLQQIPQMSNGGRYPPGKLPWQESFDGPVAFFTWTTPLANVPGLRNGDGSITPGKSIYFIIHGALADGESAYGGNWGMYLSNNGSWWYFSSYSYQSGSGQIF